MDIKDKYIIEKMEQFSIEHAEYIDASILYKEINGWDDPLSFETEQMWIMEWWKKAIEDFHSFICENKV